MRRNREQWRKDILDHLRSFPGSELSAYDLRCKLRDGSSVRLTSGSGGVKKIKDLCEEMVTEGLLTRREHRQLGAPYGPPSSVSYRAVV